MASPSISGTITFEFEPDCEPKSPYHLGLYIIDQVSAWLDGQRIGYLKIAHVSDSRLKNIKSIWQFKSAFDGWSLGLGDPDYGLVDYGELWRSAHLYAKRSPASNPEISCFALSQNNTPKIETIKKDLHVLAAAHKRKFFKFLKERVNYAYVDYINVSEVYRRQGIGTKLYTFGAMWLAINRNLVLNSSTIQSEMAKAAWEKMLADKKYPIIKKERIADSSQKQVYTFYQMNYCENLHRRLEARQNIKKMSLGLTLTN